MVRNGTHDFAFVDKSSGKSFPSAFIFDTQDGTISAWAPGFTPVSAQIVVDSSAIKASFTGLAITSNASGNFLFAADNANNVVDIFDGTFTLKGTFAADPSIPSGFSVNGIQDIGGIVYVAFAATDGGPGGFIDKYREDGTLIGTFAQGTPLNQPWGFTVAPANFGPLSGTLLVSNNTNTGTINGFNLQTGQFVATVKRHGRPIVIDQLWAIDFGGGASNPTNACTAVPNTTSANGLNCELFFTAGPANNVVGTFGKIRFVGDGDDDADDQ